MRCPVVIAALCVWSLLAAAQAVAGENDRSFTSHGIGLAVPAGWWASSGRMSNVIEPVFRMTLSDRELHRTPRELGPCHAGIARQIQPDGVVAILSEARGADFKPARFPLRSRRFALPPRRAGQDNSCLGDHATQIVFRQAGRGFYLWIATGRRAGAERIAKLLRALDAMNVAARG